MLKRSTISPSGITEERSVLMRKNAEELGSDSWRRQPTSWSLKDWNIRGKVKWLGRKRYTEGKEFVVVIKGYKQLKLILLC